MLLYIWIFLPLRGDRSGSKFDYWPNLTKDGVLLMQGDRRSFLGEGEQFGWRVEAVWGPCFEFLGDETPYWIGNFWWHRGGLLQVYRWLICCSGPKAGLVGWCGKGAGLFGWSAPYYWIDSCILTLASICFSFLWYSWGTKTLLYSPPLGFEFW